MLFTHQPMQQATPQTPYWNGENQRKPNNVFINQLPYGKKQNKKIATHCPAHTLPLPCPHTDYIPPPVSTLTEGTGIEGDNDSPKPSDHILGLGGTHTLKEVQYGGGGERKGCMKEYTGDQEL